jgi:hypothetical protein
MHLNEEALILHHYGEMDAGEESRAAAHLAVCRPCADDYATLQRVLAAVDAAQAPEPADGFERVAWARLQPHLEQRRRSSFRWFLLSPARLVWVGAVVALVVGAFLAGRLSRLAPSADITHARAAASQVRERVLLADLGDHLDRSQTLLVELTSTDAGSDFPAERARAEQLVSDNRLYRQTAEATGNAALATVLDDLERILVDVAAGPDVVSATDMDEVRQRIDRNGLLFKVRVLSSEVRQRQKAAMRLRSGQRL